MPRKAPAPLLPDRAATPKGPEPGTRERIQTTMLKSKKRRLERLLHGIKTHTDRSMTLSQVIEEGLDLWVEKNEGLLVKLRGSDNGSA